MIADISNIKDEEKLLCPSISLEERIRIADRLINETREDVEKYEYQRDFFAHNPKYYEWYRSKLKYYESIRMRLKDALFEEKIIKKKRK